MSKMVEVRDGKRVVVDLVAVKNMLARDQQGYEVPIRVEVDPVDREVHLFGMADAAGMGLGERPIIDLGTTSHLADMKGVDERAEWESLIVDYLLTHFETAVDLVSGDLSEIEDVDGKFVGACTYYLRELIFDAAPNDALQISVDEEGVLLAGPDADEFSVPWVPLCDAFPFHEGLGARELRKCLVAFLAENYDAAVAHFEAEVAELDN